MVRIWAAIVLLGCSSRQPDGVNWPGCLILRNSTSSTCAGIHGKYAGIMDDSPSQLQKHIKLAGLISSGNAPHARRGNIFLPHKSKPQHLISLTMASAYQINIVDESHSHLSPNLLQNLSLTTVPITKPGPGHVLVRIHAAALNFRDLLCLADSPVYPVRTVPGLVPCSDGAGKIVETGPNSTWQGSVGQAVILVPNRDWLDGECNVQAENTLGAGNINGTLAQYIVVEDAWVVRAPTNLSFEEAAALVSTAGTAINVLESIEVKKGTTVVTQGTGGVSCAVIQVPLPPDPISSHPCPLTARTSTPLPSAPT
jgi:hypothetical protein